MAKKKTRVLLPGGIQGLVHDLQSGKNSAISTSETLNGEKNDKKTDVAAEDRQPVDNQQVTSNVPVKGNNVAEQPEQQPQQQVNQPVSAEQQSAPSPTPTPSENGAQSINAAPSSENANGEAPSQGSSSVTMSAAWAASHPGRSYSPGRPPKQDTMKEYHIVKDDSRDSWQLFLDMAKQYKDGGGKLATIYIDSSLKNVLDRLKYAGSEKLSTSAILSSIVARFIYDHEDDIRKVLFSGDLI